MDPKTINLEGKIMGYEKKTLAVVAIVIVAALASFYAGAKYEKHKLGALGLLTNKPASQKAAPNSIKGTVTAKNEKSVTVKTVEGTKTIEFSPGMTFGKDGSGNASDIFIGELLVITGEKNADGNFIPTNMRISKKSPKQSEVAPKAEEAAPTQATDASMPNATAK